jgi:hypothetical protein
MTAYAALILAGLATFVLVQPSWGQGAASAEVTLVRKFQSSGLFPVEGQYVGYSATIKNTSVDMMQGEFLWVSFRSVSAGSDSDATFQIPALSPGQSKELSLGPFKMVENGEHRLYLGVNRTCRLGEPNDLALNYAPGSPADSFAVYSPATAISIPAGAAVAAAGAAILALYIKKRRV